MLSVSRYVLLLTAISFAYPALADNVVFSCMTKNNKQIKVLDKGNTFQYSFGKIGKPELVFANSKAEVKERTPAWSGVGRNITNRLVLKNGQYLYEIYSAIDRLTDEHEMEIGLNVSRGDKHIATILCSQQHKIENQLDIFNE